MTDRVRSGLNAASPAEDKRVRLYKEALTKLRRRGITLADIEETLIPIAARITDKKSTVVVSVGTLSALPRNLRAYSLGQRQAAERLLDLFLAQARLVLGKSTGRSRGTAQ